MGYFWEAIPVWQALSSRETIGYDSTHNLGLSSIAGISCHAEMRIESRITGIGQKPNVAGKVLVKWDYNGTVGTYICIDHSNLQDFEVGQYANDNIEREPALIAKGDIPSFETDTYC